MTTWVTLMALPVLAMAALAFDGGVILAERRAAFDAAQNAALAGAQAVDETAARQGSLVLAGSEAELEAIAYLTRIGYEGTATAVPSAAPTEVTVVVSSEVELRLLSAFGLGPRTVNATATTRLANGVDEASP